jgi:predicted transcriptional regulator
MILLPNYKNAYIDIQKLKDYCLNENHPIGKHKARVFKSILSLTIEDAERFVGLIVKGLKSNEATVGKNDIYGQRYFVDMKIINFDREAIVRTAWIIADGDNPRLITCYIKR